MPTNKARRVITMPIAVACPCYADARPTGPASMAGLFSGLAQPTVPSFPEFGRRSTPNEKRHATE
jgi:hypothetical protein